MPPKKDIKPGDIDFPTSEAWSRFYSSDTVRVPKLKKQKPVTVGGRELHTINPNEPINDNNADQLLENLAIMGILPEAAKKPQEKKTSGS